MWVWRAALGCMRSLRTHTLGDARLPRVSRAAGDLILACQSHHLGCRAEGCQQCGTSTDPSVTLRLATFCGQTGNARHQRCKRFPAALEIKSTRANSQICLCHVEINVTNPAIGATLLRPGGPIVPGITGAYHPCHECCGCS